MVVTSQMPAPTARGQAARQRYLGERVQTVSPAGLVTMLYDGLVSDLELAEAALAGGDVQVANERLLHAQAIVLELRAGLKPELWSGGPALASLYMFFAEQLMKANIAKDADLAAEVRQLVEPLRDAWHQAAANVRGAG
jgi:flagellar protein FliS